MKTASGTIYPIEGYGDLPLTFRSGRDVVPLLLLDVAHVPCLSYYIFPLRVAADERRTYTGTSDGLMVDFITGEELSFPSVERIDFFYAYRENVLIDETANATVAPGPMPNNHDTLNDINDFHVAHAHDHEGALHKTAKQMRVTLFGKMHDSKGCSSAKGIRMSFSSRTSNRAVKRLFVFLWILEARST